MLWNRIKRLLHARDIIAAKKQQAAEGSRQPLRDNLQPRSHMLALEPRLLGPDRPAEQRDENEDGQRQGAGGHDQIGTPASRLDQTAGQRRRSAWTFPV